MPPRACGSRSTTPARAPRRRYEDAVHPFELTRRLIEIESITDHEKAVGLFLTEYLRGLGWEVTLQEAAPERFNVAAFRGRPEVVFTTHIDTVPPYIPFRED